MRKSRGADLAHLTTLPPDQARARRMIHDAVESEVAIARDVGASRREGRRARRGMLRVRRIRTALPGPQDGRWLDRNSLDQALGLRRRSGFRRRMPG
jgi:hypothetical protein